MQEIKEEKIKVPPSKIIITQKRSSSTFLTKLPVPKFVKSTHRQEQSKPAIPMLNSNDKSALSQEIITAIENQPSDIIQDKAKVDAATTRPLTLPSAMELKSVLVGSPENQFIKEWKESELQIQNKRLLNFEVRNTFCLHILCYVFHTVWRHQWRFGGFPRVFAKGANILQHPR
jgi:hypothetical protein